jgi:hypothetical protein
LATTRIEIKDEVGLRRIGVFRGMVVKRAGDGEPEASER